jgi:hypothetical protein
MRVDAPSRKRENESQAVSCSNAKMCKALIDFVVLRVITVALQSWMQSM